MYRVLTRALGIQPLSIFLHLFVILFTRGRAWLQEGHARLLGGTVCGCWGGMHGCQGTCVVARGACMAAGGCVVAGGVWLPGEGCVVARGGVCGCQGACMVAGGTCMVAGGPCMVAGGMCSCWGACMVAGGHVWLQEGGVHDCWGACVVAGGMCGCWGACVVAGEVCVVARGCVWLLGAAWLLGGMRGGGMCMVGGHAWSPGGGVRRLRRDTVNGRAVRILLECILVFTIILTHLFWNICRKVCLFCAKKHGQLAASLLFEGCISGNQTHKAT